VYCSVSRDALSGSECGWGWVGVRVGAECLVLAVCRVGCLMGKCGKMVLGVSTAGVGGLRGGSYGVQCWECRVGCMSGGCGGRGVARVGFGV
jgi:hypothetical protein